LRLGREGLVVRELEREGMMKCCYRGRKSENEFENVVGDAVDEFALIVYSLDMLMRLMLLLFDGGEYVVDRE